MRTSEAVIAARSLIVARGGNEILHNLDFDIAEGTVTGLLGPSGCGKTTLMRAIVGVQRIRHGSLHVLGEVAGDRRLRGAIGYASQDSAVYSDLTVAENLSYFAAMLQVGQPRIDDVITQVALSPYRQQLVAQLSGGQRSRVNLAVALLGAPRLLVLDEPTVGLDPVLREELWQTFAALAREGATLLVSSHVMDEAERCDQLLLMREGKILAQESPESLKERTATPTMDAAFLALLREVRPDENAEASDA